MKIISLLSATIFTFLLLSCGHRQQTEPLSTLIEAQNGVEGDSAVYGLACDGCTDTILVILRDIKSNPDTLNILNATRRHSIFGSLNIGDKVAVVRNSTDSTIADCVIDIDDLRGKWCYQVMPTIRRRADMTEKSQAQMLKEMPDSLRNALFVPREYGFQILGERNIKPLGMYPHTLSSDEESPADYPSQRRYRDWHLFNGQIILSEMTTDSLEHPLASHSDTANIILLSPDTLVLRFKDEIRGYYNKKEEN